MDEVVAAAVRRTAAVRSHLPVAVAALVSCLMGWLWLSTPPPPESPESGGAIFFMAAAGFCWTAAATYAVGRRLRAIEPAALAGAPAILFGAYALSGNIAAVRGEVGSPSSVGLAAAVFLFGLGQRYRALSLTQRSWPGTSPV